MFALGDDLQVSWTAISTSLSMSIGFSIQAEAVFTLLGDKAPPTIVRLHVHKADVDILTPETAGTDGV